MNDFEGADIFAADDHFLGRITKNAFDKFSLANKFSEYGNQFNPNSIYNQFGKYGNPFSPLSPFNEFTRTPPRAVKGNKVVAYISANQFISPRIDPKDLFDWLDN